VIIGLLGYAQSGKDTVAQVLVEDHGFTRIAFADALREVAYAIDPIVGNFGDGEWPFYKDDQYLLRLREIVDEVGWDEAKQHPEIRRLLQVIGTEAGRDIHGQNVWVLLALAKVGIVGDYVFTDVRFPNEFTALVKQKAYLVRVVRPGTGPVNGHSSETALDGYAADIVLHNDGDLEYIQRLAHELVSSVGAS
jgi:hypothetical protein